MTSMTSLLQIETSSTSELVKVQANIRLT